MGVGRLKVNRVAGLFEFSGVQEQGTNRPVPSLEYMDPSNSQPKTSSHPHLSGLGLKV